MTLRMRLIKLWESLTLSFPTPDQVEDDVKDVVYQTTRIAHIVIPDTSGIAFKSSMRFRLTGRNDEMKKSCLGGILPDRVEGDIKDAVYQTTGIAFFVRIGFPIKLGMTLRTKYTNSLLKVK